MRVTITTTSEFGRAIRARRKAAGLTQSDLAAATGTTRRLISAMENGTRATSLETALAAATELGFDLALEPRT